MPRLVLVPIVAALGCAAPTNPLASDGGADGSPDARCRDVCCDVFLPAASCCYPAAPAGQQGCALGQKCGWVHVQGAPDPLGAIGCVPDGPRANGERCTYGPVGPGGYDDCVAGTACAAGTCREVCSDGVGGECPAGYACVYHDGLFGNDDPPVLGACEPAPPP